MKQEIKEQEKISSEKFKFPLIMSIITFAIGSFFVYDTIGVPLVDELKIMLTCYLPTILFILNTILMYKFNNNKKVVITFHVLTILITCGLLIYYFMAMIIITLIQAMSGVSNPIFYSHYVSGTSLTKVFPNSIPRNVTDVEFHYNPPFLQGGEIHYLYYVDKNMTSDKFDKKYRSKAAWVGHKDEYNENKGLLSSGLLMYSEGSYYSRSKHEDDFIIYLVEGKCDDSGYCNHGKFLYTAFNEKTKEVIYRAEQW